MGAWRVIAALAAFASMPLAAQQPAPDDKALLERLRATRIDIREFRFDGNTLVDTAALQAAVAPLLGKGREVRDIQRARGAILEAYASAGYEMVSVVYDFAASRGGTHLFRVREVRLGRIGIAGVSKLTEAQVRAELPSLREGEPPDLRAIARQLALFNDNPGRRATLDYAQGEPGRADVAVKVIEERPWRAALTWANTGTAQTGRSRVGLSWSHYNAFGASHQASLGVSTSLEEPQKVYGLNIGYAIPIPALGDMVSFSASHSEVKVGTVADVFNVAGNSSTWNLRYARNLVRTDDSRHVLEFGYDERRYRDLIDFFGTNIGASVTAKPLSLGYRMQRYWPGQALQLGLTWQQNLSGGARNDDAAYAASRFGADANWSTVQVDAGWQRALPGEWVISGRLSGQYASEPLIGAEQFGLGGAGAVRGFGEREGAGDRGVRGSLEVATPLIAGSHRFVAFMDAGRSRRLEALPGEVETEGLMSVGIGWRTTLGKGFQLVVDAARVADGTPRFPDGSTKVHASAVLAF